MKFYTLEEAKQYCRDNLEKGVHCPCCNQMVKLYKYNINTGMALDLIKIYKLDKKNPNQWFHVMTQVKPINGNYAKLRYWKILESKGDTPPDDKKASGFWRITPKGRGFVEDSLRIKRRVHIYDNLCLGFSGAEVTIQQALGKKFDYAELMGF